MADFVSFDEGRQYVVNNGLPSTCYFLLSTKSVDATSAFTASATLAGGVGEITGTGYARQTEFEPTATAASPSVVAFAEKTWSTGSATDWPAAVRSCVLATTADDSGKAVCAWNLQPGGAARDLSTANTVENFTPTLNVV